VTSPADLEALLAQRGAAGIEHPGGTLDEHLRRVERRLGDLGLSRQEIDVAEHAPGFLERYGAYFRRLTAAWEALLSPPVAAAARATFG
jgi:hypothetical protein